MVLNLVLFLLTVTQFANGQLSGGQISGGLITGSQISGGMFGQMPEGQNKLLGGLVNSVGGVVGGVVNTVNNVTSSVGVNTTGVTGTVTGVVNTTTTTVGNVVDGLTNGTVVGGVTGDGDVVGGLVGTVVNTTTSTVGAAVDALTGNGSLTTVGGLADGDLTGSLLGGTGVGGILNDTLTTVDNALNSTVGTLVNDTLGTVGNVLSDFLGLGFSVIGPLLSDVTGRLICDVCQDGGFDNSQDFPLEGVLISVECKVCLSASCATPIVVDINATTDSNGFFTIVDVPNVEAVGLGNQSLVSCALKIGDSPISNCSTLKAGLCGTGPDLDVDLPGLLVAEADISLSGLCLTGETLPDFCDLSGVVGDPHFTGGFGSHFDFTGLPGKSYCMISDSHLHVNMYLDGRYAQWGEIANKPLTWIRKLAIMWGHHTILLEVRTGSSWRYENGYMSHVAVDGEDMVVSGPGSSLSLFQGKGKFTWMEGRKVESDPLDLFELQIHDVLSMRIRVQPEISYMRTDEDAAVHMNIEMDKVTLTAHAHGVLGQTFRSEFREKLKKQTFVHNEQLNWDMVPGENAEGFLEGSSADYENNGSFFSATCHFSRFTRADSIDSETTEAMEIAGAQVIGRQLLPESDSDKVLYLRG